VLFFSCDSHMGPQGGQQFINLRPFCFPTIHEVIHALGFNHEQIRRDRDYYIAFNWTNTYPGIYNCKMCVVYLQLNKNWFFIESLEKTNLPTYGTSLDPSKQQNIFFSNCTNNSGTFSSIFNRIDHDELLWKCNWYKIPILYLTKRQRSSNK